MAKQPCHIMAHMNPLPDPSAGVAVTTSKNHHLGAISIGIRACGPDGLTVVPDVVDRCIWNVWAPHRTRQSQLRAQSKTQGGRWKAKAHINPRGIVISLTLAHVSLTQGGADTPAPAQHGCRVKVHCNRARQKRHAGLGNDLNRHDAIPLCESESIGALNGLELNHSPRREARVESPHPLHACIRLRHGGGIGQDSSGHPAGHEAQYQQAQSPNDSQADLLFWQRTGRGFPDERQGHWVHTLTIRASRDNGYNASGKHRLIKNKCILKQDRCNQTILYDELKNDAHFSDFESGLKPLWLRAQSGDDLAYREALRLIAGRLRAYFRRHLMNLPDDVEDLVQETLLALHLHRGSYDPSHAVTAWVLGISRHKLVDLYRRRGRREALHDPIDELEDFLAAEESGEMLANVDLRSLLDELPQAQRVAIEMTKLEGLTVAQASARTGVSESAIKVQVHRGLKRLAVLVRKEPT